MHVNPYQKCIKCEPGYGYNNANGITKEKKCKICKINTYSPGGDDVKCKQCPPETPTTHGETGRRRSACM